MPHKSLMKLQAIQVMEKLGYTEEEIKEELVEGEKRYDEKYGSKLKTI